MVLRHSSRRALTNQKAFTLIEAMIVIGLVAIIGGLSMYFGMESYRGYTFRSDRDLLITVLQHARAEAVNNICMGAGCTDGKPHGVYIGGGQYVLFQGASYASRDTVVDASLEMNPNTVHTGISEVVFEQLSGDASQSGDIVLSEATGRVSTTTVGAEGQILWTN